MDQAVINFVVQGLHPFGVVEQPGFINLIQHTMPNYTVMSRTTVRAKIEIKNRGNESQSKESDAEH